MQNPGSINEFMQNNGYKSTQEATPHHSEALQVYRQELAAEKGIDVVDLHYLPHEVGEIATSAVLRTNELS